MWLLHNRILLSSSHIILIFGVISYWNYPFCLLGMRMCLQNWCWEVVFIRSVYRSSCWYRHAYNQFIQYVFSKIISSIAHTVVLSLILKSLEAAGALMLLLHDLWIVWCFGILSDFPNGSLKCVVIRVSHCIIGRWEATENIIINLICLIKSFQLNSCISQRK